MKGDWKQRCREWLPPAVIRLLLPHLGMGIQYGGRYADMASAAQHCATYAAAEILDNVAAATQAVLRGEAPAERDGVLLASKPVPYPIIAEILFSAARAGGKRLAVCDFGGSLGSVYRACDDFLAPLPAVAWGVVEQSHFVAYGQEHLADGRLQFYPSIEACCQAIAPDVLVLSSVLQYLEHPREFLGALAAGPWTSIIIDRTPLVSAPASFVAIQKLPKRWRGGASYPSWLFRRDELLDSLKGFTLIAEFPASDGSIGSGAHRADFHGFIFRRARA